MNFEVLFAYRRVKHKLKSIVIVKIKAKTGLPFLFSQELFVSDY